VTRRGEKGDWNGVKGRNKGQEGDQNGGEGRLEEGNLYARN
jgi:hypothetical protein